MAYYDRYKNFRVDGAVKHPLPFFAIDYGGSDISLFFDRRTMRLDTLSYKYYGDPNYAWLILNANPGLPPYEYLIDDGSPIRIPYPLSDAIARYERSITRYMETADNNE
jgi:phage tail protein X